MSGLTNTERNVITVVEQIKADAYAAGVAAAEQRITEAQATALREAADQWTDGGLVTTAKLRRFLFDRADALARPTDAGKRDPELSPSRDNCDGCVNAAFEVGTTDRPLRPDGHDVACAVALARPADEATP